MVKYPALIFVVLLLFSNCFADTFVHRYTGETFNGYYLQRKRGGKTQVHIEKKPPRYLGLGSYKIQRNYLGRKDRVYVLSIKDSIDLICETEAFEKAIVLAANQGPLFILIDIDTPGGKAGLAQRICNAIIAVDNCTTVAYVSGDRFGGAFSEGAIIALACDKLYMRKGTSIGAAPPYVAKAAFSPEAIEEGYGQPAAGQFNSAWSAYCAALAERNNRPPLLVKAMVDKDVEVVEISENGKTLFIDPANKPPNQAIIRIWSRKGSLLTLTAAEAAQSGVVDGMVASREELFAGLEAMKATQVRDTRILKARRNFERARRKVDRLIPVITDLQQRSAGIVEDVNTLDQEIRRANELAYRGLYWSPYMGVDIYELEGMLIARDELLGRLLFILNNLMANYRRVLSAAEKYPDLSDTANAIRDSLDAAQATYRRFQPRFRFRY